MLTQQQTQERLSFVGGSDVGAIIGVNPYRSPLDVYLEKTSKVLPADLSKNPSIHFGNVLENVIAKEYARRTGQKVRRRNQTFTHQNLPWARANIDRSVDGEKMILEIKTADKWTADMWGEEGTDDVPDSYMAQVVWYMSVLDYERADLAVLIGGNDFRIYHFARDWDLEEMIVNKVINFWNDNVLADIAPEPINDRDLKTLYAIDNGQSIKATSEIIDRIRYLKEIKQDIKTAEELKKHHEFEIKKFMGHSAQIIVNEHDKPLLTWKTSKGSRAFDDKKLKAECPNIWDEYAFDRPGSRRFLIK